MRSWLDPEDPAYNQYYGSHADGGSFYNTIVQGQSGYLSNLMRQLLGQDAGGVGIPAGVGASSKATSSSLLPSTTPTAGVLQTSAPTLAATSTSKMSLSSWLPLLIGQLGSAAIGGALQPSPQKRRSYADLGVDLGGMVKNVDSRGNEILDLLMDYLSKDVELPSSYAPPVPGASISDPAAGDKSLLKRPGMLSGYKGKAVKRRTPSGGDF